MRILIIEDEAPAVEKLHRFIQRFNPSFEVVKSLDSVASSVNYLQNNNKHFDLIFMDIELRDGKSFEILDQVPIDKPVIFTTAYDEYALEAFKLNSIAYLLKPYTYEEFSNALNKLIKLKNELQPEVNLQALTNILGELGKQSYKERFMVKLGDHLRAVKAPEIAYFYADGRTVYLVTKEGRKFIIDFKLEELEEMVDPAYFFRVNRSFILHIDAIRDVSSFTNSRLKITFEPSINKDVIVSRERVAQFKNWFSGH